MKHIKGLLFAIAVVVASVAGFTMSVTAEELLEDILKRGTLRVGMASFVPWVMRDNTGNLIGFEIDVARKVATDMDVDVEFVLTPWSGIIPALVAKKFDIIISGMSITPQRNLTVNFTIPYAHSGQQMVASKALAGGFTSLNDYNAKDVTITCRRGATPCDFAQKVFPKATIQRFDDDAHAFQAVVNGQAHAIISSAPLPAFWADDHPDKVFVANGGKNLSRSDEAFALRKGDADALKFFSNWIVVNTSNGWLGTTHDYWFKHKSAWKDRVAVDL